MVPLWQALALAALSAGATGCLVRGLTERQSAETARRQADAVRGGTRRFYGREWLLRLGRRDGVARDRYEEER